MRACRCHTSTPPGRTAGAKGEKPLGDALKPIRDEVTAFRWFQYPTLPAELQELGMLLDGRDAVLDGEIVALESGERPSFSRLQARMHVAQPSRSLLATTPVSYYVFDVLRLGAKDLTVLPYATRRDVLAGLGLSGMHVRVPRNFVNVDGQSVLEAAELAGLEGVL